MNTITLISSISYNTPAFLKAKFAQLHDTGVIDWAHWIEHEPEEDEKKKHVHFVLQPSRRVDTEALRKEFVEPVQGSEPLGCLPFFKSKIRDWLLYAVHDVGYLLDKGQSRKHHYSVDDILSTDVDLVREQFKDTFSPLKAKVAVVKQMFDEGLLWVDVLSRGVLSVNEVFYFGQLWRGFEEARLRRGKGLKHE